MSAKKTEDSIVPRPNRVRNQAELIERIRQKKKLTKQPVDTSQRKSGSTDQISRPSYAKTIQIANTQAELSPSSNVVDRYEDEEHMKVLERKYLQAKDPPQKSSSSLARKETSYLSKASFRKHLEELDENGRALLDQLDSLKKSSANPRHLTIVHAQLAERISKLVHTRIEKARREDDDVSSVFVELQPGFGLVTKSLIDLVGQKSKQDSIIDKFIMIEAFAKFDSYIKEIASTRANVYAFRQKSFDNPSFLSGNDHETSRLIDLIEDEKNSSKNNHEPPSKVNLHVFGILPWNCKGYMSKTFGDFASNRSLFSLNADRVRSTELLLYIPNFLLGKLKRPPSPNKRSSKSSMYAHKNSSLSVLNALLTHKFEILDEQKCEYFYPYPILSSSNKFRSDLVGDEIDFKKISLVSLRFQNRDDLVQLKHKRLLYLFIMQMFVRPTLCIKEPLRSVCKNVNILCKETSISQYIPVNSLNPFKFLTIFQYLLEHPELSNLSYLEQVQTGHARTSWSQQRAQKIKTLNNLNKEFSGMFVVDDDADEGGEGGGGDDGNSNVNNQNDERRTTSTTTKINSRHGEQEDRTVQLVNHFFEPDFDDFDLDFDTNRGIRINI